MIGDVQWSYVFVVIVCVVCGDESWRDNVSIIVILANGQRIYFQRIPQDIIFEGDMQELAFLIYVRLGRGGGEGSTLQSQAGGGGGGYPLLLFTSYYGYQDYLSKFCREVVAHDQKEPLLSLLREGIPGGNQRRSATGHIYLF